MGGKAVFQSPQRLKHLIGQASIVCELEVAAKVSDLLHTAEICSARALSCRLVESKAAAVLLKQELRLITVGEDATPRRSRVGLHSLRINEH